MDLYFESKKIHESENELDFANHWTDPTVQRELQRGIELRQQKERHVTNIQESDVVNVDYIKPPPMCGETGFRRKKLRRRSTSPRSPKRGISPAKNMTYRKPKCQRNKCPMRIVELAVPTKRQCFETWKTNAHVLPDVMIDRLRQYVYDQKPIVQISDAIQCFKNRKNQKKRKALDKYKNVMKEQNRSNKKVSNKRLQLNLRDMKNFCAIFGYKMSQKLVKPMTITLSTECERIAHIVFGDITDLMLKDKCINNEYLYKNCKIQTEIACKIALWMRYILDESYFKNLEDQLQDLEDEEGPVLDLLDDLFDNVLDICIPQVDTDSESTYSSILLNTPKQGSDESTNISEQDKDTTHDFIRNIINDIIDDDVIPDIDGSSIQSPELVSDNLDTDFIANDLSDDYAAKDIEQRSVTTDSNEEEGVTEGDIENADNLEEERNNVSDFSEDLNDGNDKKVKFAHTDMVTSDRDNSNNSDSHSNILNQHKLSGLHDSKQNLVLSEPNENLLSDADESWPSDVDPHELKPSESVSKSITSLGKIFETDEKSSIEEYHGNVSTDETELRGLVDIIRKEKFDNIDEKVESKYSFDSDNFKETDDGKNDLISDDQTTALKNAVIKLFEEKSVQIDSRQLELSRDQKKYLKDMAVNTSLSLRRGMFCQSIGKADRVTKKEIDDVKIYPLKPKQMSSYKVPASKVTSWAKYEEDNSKQRKQKPNFCQIQRWCKDLENAYNNLELWTEWIDTTLRNMNGLKYASAGNTCTAKRNKSNQWINFTKDVEDDAHVWLNTSTKSRKLLNSYRTLYQNPQEPPVNRLRSCKCNHN